MRYTERVRDGTGVAVITRGRVGWERGRRKRIVCAAAIGLRSPA